MQMKAAGKNGIPRVFVYGLDDTYRIVHFYFIPGGRASVRAMRNTGSTLRAEYPSIKHVYAVDDHKSLYRMYKDTVKKPSVENCVTFKLMLEQYGMEV